MILDKTFLVFWSKPWTNIWFLCCMLQGCLKKTPEFSSVTKIVVTCKPCDGFTICFFSWELRSMRKFWIQNHFCAILEGRDIYKYGSETDQFIFIVTHTELKHPLLGPIYPNLPKTIFDISHCALSDPSIPNSLNCYQTVFYFDPF